MTRREILAWCVVSVAAAASCGRQGSPPATSSQPFELGLTLEPLQTPAPSGSAHPQLTTSPQGAILSWLEQQETTTTLRFAERTSAGWSEVRVVEERYKPLIVGMYEGS